MLNYRIGLTELQDINKMFRRPVMTNNNKRVSERITMLCLDVVMGIASFVS